MQKRELSVVAPCYNEEAGLEEFARRTSAACQVVTQDYEIILVDDGSSDQTWSKIQALADADPHIVGVELFRNHGHQLAVTAGLSLAQGERVLLIDADLQDPPELLHPMTLLMDKGYDVVFGQRISRAGESRFKLLSASAFYRILNMMSSAHIPQDVGDFRLMSREVVELLRDMPEQTRFIRGMVSWIGGRQIAYPYARDCRHSGTTKYPLRKMISFAVDAFTSFSTKPLRIAVWLGLLSSLFAFSLLVYALYRWLTGDVVPGWASSLGAIAFFSGIQLFVMGVFGEYLGRLVHEGKRRPLFAIRTIHSGQAGLDEQSDVEGNLAADDPYRQKMHIVGRRTTR